MKSIKNIGAGLKREALKNIKGGIAAHAAAYCRGTCLPGRCPETDGPYSCVCDTGLAVPMPPGICKIYSHE
ncbi:hypothetical protein KTO58_15390 [Chitinophaga pendula]|uniref:hypothetical protein n=1 Tax=Chitinophaga TaxID=79328 RepID=UPI000BB0BFB9|nr:MULTISPECIES: hypothetical protein [Chitinophaga]ASZ11895.1 hypothetical protein CK934_13465 [Chitinophaga sp. MD30]UCJ05080.1 hypothetical protein KTO58_15390 [Chitinophaga pendula]